MNLCQLILPVIVYNINLILAKKRAIPLILSLTTLKTSYIMELMLLV